MKSVECVVEKVAPECDFRKYNLGLPLSNLCRADVGRTTMVQIARTFGFVPDSPLRPIFFNRVFNRNCA